VFLVSAIDQEVHPSGFRVVVDDVLAVDAFFLPVQGRQSIVFNLDSDISRSFLKVDDFSPVSKVVDDVYRLVGGLKVL